MILILDDPAVLCTHACLANVCVFVPVGVPVSAVLIQFFAVLFTAMFLSPTTYVCVLMRGIVRISDT